MSSLAKLVISQERRAATAAGFARRISADLKRGGFIKSNTLSRYAWTEGFRVSRVGYSSEVDVDWNIPGNHGEAKMASRREMREKIRVYLTGLGYKLSPCLWVNTEDPYLT